MHKVVIAALAAAAFTSTAAMADDTSMSPQPVSQTMTSDRIVCHHDGEVIQAQSGPVICHLKRPEIGMHNMSRAWFRDQQLRGSTMNH
jgi:hypothetical protein